MKINVEDLGALSVDGIFIYNLGIDKFEYVNDCFAQGFNSSIPELMQDPGKVLTYILEEDNYYLRHNYYNLLNTRTVNGVELRSHVDGNKLMHLKVDAYLFDNRIFGIVRDVTKDKEHENYIVDYGAKKDTMLDMMSHNLSGPLALTQNLLTWTKDSLTTKSSEEIQSGLELIQDNTQQCLAIVNDLLAQEHSESPQIFIKKTRFDVLDRIVATLDKLIITNKSRTFKLVTELEHLNITSDGVKFFQIIHNLVSNAIKFTPDNGTIEIIVIENESTFVVQVKDNGVGIPEEYFKNIFDRKGVARRPDYKQRLSSGLGLSIVKALVDLLKGTISFESREGLGTTFSVELPKD